MGFLQQASSSIADTSKMSFSIWFKLVDSSVNDSGGKLFNIVSWGSFAPADTTGACSSIMASTGTNGLMFQILGQTGKGGKWTISQDDMSGDTVWVFNGYVGGSNSGPTDDGTTTTTVKVYDPPGFANLMNPSIPMAASTWYHLAYSFDLATTPFVYTTSGARTISVPFNHNIVLNGATVRAGPLQDDISYTNPFADEVTVGPMLTGINAMPFQISGRKHPLEAEPVETVDQRIQFGPVAIWTDQYIDWTNSANLARVVSSTGVGHGKPTKKGDLLALGMPKVYFDGTSSSAFLSNSGSGGPFTLTGTISELTGPSF